MSESNNDLSTSQTGDNCSGLNQAASHEHATSKPGQDLSLEQVHLDLLKPVAETKMQAWLSEFYGKEVEIVEREVLRHRDLSRVERLVFRDALPASLIYKQVLPPWDVEQDLHERILIPSISNSPQLFMAAHSGQVTAMLMEDLGPVNLLTYIENEPTAKVSQVAHNLGEELAKMHRSYSYRTDELMPLGILRSLSPIDYETTARSLADSLSDWHLGDGDKLDSVVKLAALIAEELADEPISLTHGDLYAENIILRHDKLFLIDWSWFSMLSVPLVDLATVTMTHQKNGAFAGYAATVIEAYCFESGRDEAKVREKLPYAEALSRVLFLDWLVERKERGIEGTTVGPVNNLIEVVLDELKARRHAL